MTRPTLDHFPKGSRLTPLLIRACVNRKKKVIFHIHFELQIQVIILILHLRQVSPPGFKGIGPNGDRPLNFVGLQKIYKLK